MSAPDSRASVGLAPVGLLVAVREAQRTVDRHAYSYGSGNGLCGTCGRPGPCPARRRALGVLTRSGRLPRMTPLPVRLPVPTVRAGVSDGDARLSGREAGRARSRARSPIWRLFASGASGEGSEGGR